MLSGQLHRRYAAGEGRVVRPVSETERAGFGPKDAWCHEIVARWIEEHPDHRAIRGWIATNEYIFDKHSVVDTGQEWIDVTPRVANQYRRFLVHEGSEESFRSIVPTQQVNTPDMHEAHMQEDVDDQNLDDSDEPTQAF